LAARCTDTAPLLKNFKDARNYDYKVMQRGQFFWDVNVAKDTARK